MGLGIRTRITDVFDVVYRKLCALDLPPFSLRARVGLIEDYERIPPEFIAYFRLLCDLKMDQQILDIGCGPGKFATQLRQVPYSFRGEYRGFDIHQESIDWARRNITQDNPNFRFEYTDLYNSNYNPNGKCDPESFSFPYADEEFDFAFAISVFTHLTPATAQRYLNELQRVLKPGGKALLTFLLLDGYRQELSQTSQAALGFFLKALKVNGAWHHRDGHSVISTELPEAIVAYQESDLGVMVKEANMKVQKIYHGAWNEAEDYLSFQDIVVLQK